MNEPIRKILAVVNPPQSVDGRFLGVCALIAFIGGAAKAVLRRNEKTTVVEVFAAATGSSLAGFCAGAICLYLWPGQQYLALAICGVSSWAGLALLDAAGDIAMKQLKKKTRD